MSRTLSNTQNARLPVPFAAEYQGASAPSFDFNLAAATRMNHLYAAALEQQKQNGAGRSIGSIIH